MEMIKSKDNPLVKQVAALMQNRKDRVKNGAFVAEGARFCGEAVITGANIKHTLMTEDFYASHKDEAQRLESVCSDVRLISEAVADKLGATVNSQGVFCVCDIPKSENTLNGSKYICLEEVRDPGNIGTIIRSAEAFGMDGVILIGNCADVYSPKVLRSTMGTIFRLPIISFDCVQSAFDAFKKGNFMTFGAVLERNSKKLSEISFDENTICLIGNEANGLTKEAQNSCDDFLFIEMSGGAESLNAAVAASVIMYKMQK